MSYHYLEKDGVIFRRQSIPGVTCHPVEEVWDPRRQEWVWYTRRRRGGDRVRLGYSSVGSSGCGG